MLGDRAHVANDPPLVDDEHAVVLRHPAQRARASELSREALLAHPRDHGLVETVATLEALVLEQVRVTANRRDRLPLGVANLEHLLQRWRPPNERPADRLAGFPIVEHTRDLVEVTPSRDASGLVTGIQRGNGLGRRVAHDDGAIVGLGVQQQIRVTDVG